MGCITSVGDIVSSVDLLLDRLLVDIVDIVEDKYESKE